MPRGPRGKGYEFRDFVNKSSTGSPAAGFTAWGGGGLNKNTGKIGKTNDLSLLNYKLHKFLDNFTSGTV
jgi:hypothetical protein